MALCGGLCNFGRNASFWISSGRPSGVHLSGPQNTAIGSAWCKGKPGSSDISKYLGVLSTPLGVRVGMGVLTPPVGSPMGKQQ